MCQKNKHMKNFINLIAILLIFQLSAQNTISTKAWQDDLKFLQHTVHSEYSFLFKKTTAEAFDAKVDALYKAIPTLQEHEIITGFARVVSSFKYGHTSFGFRGGPIKFHRLPLNLYLYNDGLFIQAAKNQYAEHIGAKITRIGDMTTEEALKAIYPVVPAENDQFFKSYGVLYITSPEILHAQGVIKTLSNTVSFTLEKDGKTYTQQFTAPEEPEMVNRNYGYVDQEGWTDAREQGETPYYLKNLDKIYYYEYFPEKKTVYVRQSQIQDDPSEAIPAFYERVFDFIDKNDVERLIIDVRLNGGGNNYKNKPVITGIIKSEKINKPGSLFVIIGRRTFSACQNLVNEMSNYTNAIFIGEPTAENVNFYGDNNRIELPNSKFPVYLSFAWWQDKPQWEGAEWTAPHVAIDMSFEDYRTNNDPVLNAALGFKDDNFKLDPMGHLTNLFMTGQMEQLQVDAKRMVADPAYRFVDFESELNRAGYQLLNSGQMQEAAFVFQFNTELFPESANTWDSLGEIQWKMEQKDKAIEYYNKAIALDPDGKTGDNAREMIRQIKEEN